MAAGSDLMRVVNTLSRERARQSKPQHELAAAIDRSQGAVSRYEGGVALPDVETLFRWAAALGGRIVVEFPQIDIEEAIERTPRRAAPALEAVQ